ncbi:uncharacterized protein B0I36DRAFT_158109 [Microdochium trichocladiopsis]|uniref:Uncharacterized protein n=1 Tax=Microdochium trichocladiopsis TaxID=1682393 RepID=A0A9P8Y082_9PEZI|nr:uncharacterized protein B0I36DRAFT_158109 [Microdochium trichocladiopsis]KAH7026404.1 hypothetical protein B0I36DRAFT_158109 [Microdochium trichocladiopsis]
MRPCGETRANLSSRERAKETTTPPPPQEVAGPAFCLLSGGLLCPTKPSDIRRRCERRQICLQDNQGNSMVSVVLDSGQMASLGHAMQTLDVCSPCIRVFTREALRPTMTHENQGRPARVAPRPSSSQASLMHVCTSFHHHHHHLGRRTCAVPRKEIY